MIDHRQYRPDDPRPSLFTAVKHGISNYRSFYGKMLSTSQKHYESMSNTLQPEGLPQASSAGTRGSVRTFGDDAGGYKPPGG